MRELLSIAYAILASVIVVSCSDPAARELEQIDAEILRLEAASAESEQAYLDFASAFGNERNGDFVFVQSGYADAEQALEEAKLDGDPAKLDQARKALGQMNEIIDEVLGVTEGGIDAAYDRHLDLQVDLFSLLNELHMVREKREALLAK